MSTIYYKAKKNHLTAIASPVIKQAGNDKLIVLIALKIVCTGNK
jgi:hypothetical protein